MKRYLGASLIVACACTSTPAPPPPATPPSASSTFPDVTAVVPPGSDAPVTATAPAGTAPIATSSPAPPPPGEPASPPPGEPAPPGGPKQEAAADPKLAKLRARFRQCYQKELQQDPDAGGKVAFDLLVDAKGHVKDVKIACGTTSPALSACLRKAMLDAQEGAVYEGGPRTIRVGECK